MPIKIVRNAAGNCINFEGSAQPTYWNACLSGEVNTEDSDRVNVINDVRSIDGDIEYEFFAIPYTEFLDADGNDFSSSQEVVDYIDANANVRGIGEGLDLTGQTVNFRLDETSTSIVLDNGYQFGVNTIKADADTDGTIHIYAIDAGLPADEDSTTADKKHFFALDHTMTYIDETLVSGGLADVVNTLNELFTVGPFQSVVIQDPYATIVADVDGVDIVNPEYIGDGLDVTGDDVYGSSDSGALNGYKSVETIDQAGEYFTFDIRSEGQIGFGLIHTQESYDDGNYLGNANYADPTTFGTSNNSHYGFQFSHWFHPTPNGSSTNYGANTAHVQGPAWYDSNTHFEGRDEWLAGDPVKIKVGIDENSFIAIYSLADDDITWKLHARTAYPIPEGSEFHLGIKTGDTIARVYTLPKVHLLDSVQPPTSLGTTDITIFGENVTGTLAGGITANATDGFDNDGFVSTQTINEVGEYFEFTWSAGGDANFGLFSENDHDVSDLTSDTTSWGNDDYIFYGARAESNGEMTASFSEDNLAYTLIGSGSDSSFSQYYGRVGFDGQGRPTVWFSVDGTVWTVFHHGQASAPTGDYKFIWVAQDDGSVLDTLQQGEIDTAPVMNFRYIESPDGNFHYPLFATEEEANYYDLENGGTGTNSSNVYPDDPTFYTWYEPTSGHTNNGTSAPTSATTFQGVPILWTEITSLTNADLAPPAFSGLDQQFSENTSVNLQITPQDVGYSTSVSGLPDGLTYDGVQSINGTTGYVPETTVYTITVTRTNSYGSSQGSFDLTILDNISIGTLTDFTTVDGNFLQPNRIILTHDALATYNTVLSEGQEITFSYGLGEMPPTIGILSSQGETDLSSFDSATDTLGSGDYNFAETDKWDLRFVTFGGYIGSDTTEFNLVGWEDNTTITGTNENIDAEFKLVYEDDTANNIVLYRNGVEILRSADIYSGDQTIRIAGFDDQPQTDVYVPDNFAISNTGAGSTTPPSGFTDPLEAGSMASTTLLGNEDDSVVKISQTLRVNHRYIIPQTWIEHNLLPNLGTGKFFFGVPSDTADYEDSPGITEDDFWAFFSIEGGSISQTSVIKTIGDSQSDSDTITINSLTDAYYDYAIEWDGTDLHVIACSISALNSEPGIADSGLFTRVVTYSGFATEQSKTNQSLELVIGVDMGAQVQLSTSSLQMIRIPFTSGTILAAEHSGGNGYYLPSALASDFDEGGQHAPSNTSFGGLSTLNAGQTYRFIYDPSLESNDFIEFRLASDNTTVYNTGITTFDNTSDGDPKATENYKGLTFVVPSDAPPLKLYHYNGFTSSYDNGAARPISISGSTYVETVTGITLEGPAANQTGTNVMDAGDHGWISLDEQLAAGERLVLDNAFFTDFLAETKGNNTIFAIGLKGDNWTNTTEISSNGAGAAVQNSQTFKGNTYIVGIWSSSSSNVTMWICANGILGNSLYMNQQSVWTTACAFLEISNSGDNIRAGMGRNNSTGNITQGDESTVAYADWNAYKGQTGEQGYGISSIDVVMSFWTFGGGAIDGNEIDWTGLSEIAVPTPAATLTTNWTKALDFSGSSERTQMVNSSYLYNPLNMGNISSTTSIPVGTTYSSNDTNARPWATAVVFSSDNNSSNQHIWNCGEGTGSADDNIYVRVDANRNLYFGWGRTGALNECVLGSLSASAGTWYGLYIAHNGTRLSGGHSSGTIASHFDIHLVNLSTGVVGSNLSTGSNWNSGSFGGRMDRQFTGSITIGGRGSNRNFHGKVAAMVSTTLMRNAVMPTDAEISMMVRDPMQWLTDYRVGQTYRHSSGTTTSTFALSSLDSSYATQVWLMGDGTSDAYAQIRNQVYPGTQNNTPMNMISMVSSDIQNVTISGLT